MSTFPERLTELRTEKNISQKEAAAGLGISQALLSHYEKGIRECGLVFLCRAADYYSVTADYLLGRSMSRSGLSENAMEDREDDAVFSPATVYRAAIMACERLSVGGASAGEQANILYALAVYRALLAASNRGYISKRWFSLPPKYSDGFALASAERLLRDFPERTVDLKRKSGGEPLCVQTLIAHAEELLRKTAAAVRENHPHDITITQEAPNYSRGE